jgi:hypothetical protein
MVLGTSFPAAYLAMVLTTVNAIGGNRYSQGVDFANGAGAVAVCVGI